MFRLKVLRYFLNETVALRESPTNGLEEGSVSLSACRLGSRISTGGRWRRGGEPEPNEESKRLRSDSQVTLQTFGLAGKTIEASRGPKKVILNVTYKCNNRCTFCATGTRTQFDGDYDRQKELLVKYRRLGVRLLDLDGGEPTLNPKLFSLVRFARPRLDTAHTHGTGCVLSAAVAALLARGLGLRSAIAGAKAFVWQGLQAGRSLGVGHGRGPVDCLFGIARSPLPLP